MIFRYRTAVGCRPRVGPDHPGSPRCPRSCMSVREAAERLGISRQRGYAILRATGRPVGSSRPDTSGIDNADCRPLVDFVLEAAIRHAAWRVSGDDVPPAVDHDPVTDVVWAGFDLPRAMPAPPGARFPHPVSLVSVRSRWGRGKICPLIPSSQAGHDCTAAPPNATAPGVTRSRRSTARRPASNMRSRCSTSLVSQAARGDGRWTGSIDAPVQASCGRSVTACHRGHLTVLLGHGQIDRNSPVGARPPGCRRPAAGREIRRSVSDTLSRGQFTLDRTQRIQALGDTPRRRLTAAQDIGCAVAW
jgi:hypothetical protein